MKYFIMEGVFLVLVLANMNDGCTWASYSSQKQKSSLFINRIKQSSKDSCNVFSTK